MPTGQVPDDGPGDVRRQPPPSPHAGAVLRVVRTCHPDRRTPSRSPTSPPDRRAESCASAQAGPARSDSRRSLALETTATGPREVAVAELLLGEVVPVVDHLVVELSVGAL